MSLFKGKMLPIQNLFPIKAFNIHNDKPLNLIIMNLPQKLFKEYMERFNNYSAEQIIEAFNREVGCRGWGTARASYLGALYEQLNIRQFDYSQIGDKTSLSFRNRITLKNNIILICISPH
jgi:hypothetical protein